MQVRWRPWPPRRRCLEAWETGSKRGMQTSAEEHSLWRVWGSEFYGARRRFWGRRKSISFYAVAGIVFLECQQLLMQRRTKPWTYSNKTRFTESYMENTQGSKTQRTINIVFFILEKLRLGAVSRAKTHIGTACLEWLTLASQSLMKSVPRGRSGICTPVKMASMKPIINLDGVRMASEMQPAMVLGFHIQLLTLSILFHLKAWTNFRTVDANMSSRLGQESPNLCTTTKCT